ncbi:SDR family NAD(P)-dependent oxidoreductase [Microbacterium sp. 10M-3C3]|jgi:short-subunit dehydrogenase involved in D-alanine esterification of teichoic acids|uniref:SDR family oxidoreductase n=1 Tax=Microbacterium sp. 10M-3C3 TaxID=2483401 RepID=UPI000F63259C|nr:SDR family NAD(P)-dependent oxidoreductase [Microbacterium sp. 10M-3C3]
MRISGNTIFIPGATSGIGLALATRLHDAGNTVIVGGRREELLAEIAAQHPGIDTVRIDTTDADSIAAASADVLARHPGLNVVIAMAGIMRVENWPAGGFRHDAEDIVTTNLLGPIRLIDVFLPHLLAQPDATLMTVSSGLAFVPLRVTPTYNATKAAIHMLSETLRLQLAGTSVRVVELEPPSVATDLMPGQRDSDFAMPLDAFADEVLTILRERPDVTEVQVERVKFLRYAEQRGDYPDVVATLNAADPHAAA